MKKRYKKNSKEDRGSFLPLALVLSTLLAFTTLQLLNRAHEAEKLAQKITQVAPKSL